MSITDPILQIVLSQHQIATESRQRRLVVLSGERLWAVKLAQRYSQHQLIEKTLWVSDQAPTGQASIEKQQAKVFLGQDLGLLVFDAWAGFDPDALAVVTGSLCGGGLLILLIPPKQQWPQYNDPDYQRLLVHLYQTDDIQGRFIQQILRSFNAASSSCLIEQGQPLPELKPTPIPLFKNEPAPRDDQCVTTDQAKAVAAVMRVLTGHSRRPLVIKSDRGRGKSSALGIASALLMQQSPCKIVITAPRADAVQAVFKRAAAILSLTAEDGLSFQYQHSSLRFIAADELLRNHYDIDLLLVDEAAAIPASMLTQLLTRHNRVVFATTVHGYEGTGRGFDLRFKQTLDKITPQWKTIELSTPIRWAEGDPVEHWLFDALLLDACAADDTDFKALQATQCVVEKINRDDLIDDTQSLRQIFGLLISAHYQTTPSDLRVLLDGPNISVWVSRFQGNIIAAALVAEEGGFDRDLSLLIWQGKRRPRGHLLPQTLSAHSGFQVAPEMRYQRVVRIAVHPQAQRRCIAKQLMAKITSDARDQQCDFVGSSFAASVDVLAFWRSIGCVPVKLGVNRDASSGCYSAVVLSALSAQANELLAVASHRFAEQWPLSLANIYQQLETDVVAELFASINPEFLPALDQQDFLDVEAFAEGYRQYDMCRLSLWKLVCLRLSDSDSKQVLDTKQQQLLISRLLQNHPLKTVADDCGLSGKKQLINELRQLIKLLQCQQPQQ